MSGKKEQSSLIYCCVFIDNMKMKLNIRYIKIYIKRLHFIDDFISRYSNQL